MLRHRTPARPVWGATAAAGWGHTRLNAPQRSQRDTCAVYAIVKRRACKPGQVRYRVPPISRLLQNIGLFCEMQVSFVGLLCQKDLCIKEVRWCWHSVACLLQTFRSPRQHLLYPCVHTRMRIYAPTHTYIHTHTHAHTHTHTHTLTHTYTHAHTHTHTHIYILELLGIGSVLD